MKCLAYGPYLFLIVVRTTTLVMLNQMYYRSLPLVRRKSPPSNLSRVSIAYWAILLLNTISVDIRRCDSLAAFSQSYVTYLWSQIDVALIEQYHIVDFIYMCSYFKPPTRVE
jgi:hypothetical protein